MLEANKTEQVTWSLQPVQIAYSEEWYSKNNPSKGIPETVFSVVCSDDNNVSVKYTIRHSQRTEYHIDTEVVHGVDAYREHYKFLCPAKALCCIDSIVRTGSWQGE